MTGAVHEHVFARSLKPELEQRLSRRRGELDRRGPAPLGWAEAAVTSERVADGQLAAGALAKPMTMVPAATTATERLRFIATPFLSIARALSSARSPSAAIRPRPDFVRGQVRPERLRRLLSPKTHA
jgi:hypothetical protein